MAHFFAFAGIYPATGPGGFQHARLPSRDAKFFGSMGWYSGRAGNSASAIFRLDIQARKEFHQHVRHVQDDSRQSITNFSVWFSVGCLGQYTKRTEPLPGARHCGMLRLNIRHGPTAGPQLTTAGSPDFSWQVFSAACRLHLRRFATWMRIHTSFLSSGVLCTS